ncbi:putative 3 exoribonuclease family protein [Rosellinia necatrix]|uniref:Putative 3 exoribonuclease family protein n=1 Tax=Rosellinia necatrix TaxID=77044 RepID=A0A1W2TBF6_ROSNE|nr:putative 3 exoribonuclease family protein [Rosellinia necatrix]
MRGRKAGTGRPSRAAGAVSRPTPIAPVVPSAVSSTVPTPLSSAYPSTYASEAEYDLREEIEKLPLDALSLGPAAPPSGPKPRRVKQQPFRFLELPSELRLKVYEHHFANTGHVLDLDPDNYKRIHQKLAILRVCRTIYVEASYSFYSTHPVRVFPTHPGRFFKTKKPLLARMKPGQRACLSSLELRLGPGWSKPPRGWEVNPALGLSQCVSVTKLTVFVECDPGNDIFKGFRQPGGFFETFSKKLLTGILDEMPWVQRVEFDAWSSVKKSGALMTGLIDLIKSRSLKITWGQERGWTDAEEVEPPPVPNNYAPLDSLLNATNNILVLA